MVGLTGALASCVPVDEPASVGQATQEVILSNVNERDVVLTANVLADWGMKKQISAALVKNHTLTVRYCAEHFPQSSLQLEKLKLALGGYNGAPGVAINLVDVAEAAGTTTHPDLTTFALPANAIYVDYSPDLANDVWASTGLPDASCDNASPRQCSQARLYVNANKYTTETPSTGVFMHELGHVFGLSHINEPDDTAARLDPSDMWIDRSIVHGPKNESNDDRGIVIHAGTLAWLRQYYAATTNGTLDTDEIAAHQNVSFVGTTSGGITPHYEWNMAKTFGWGTGTTLADGLNEVKLKWSSLSGAYEPCSAPGTQPHWFARMSETSTSIVDRLFEAVFEVTNSDAGTNWSQVASETFDSYIEGQSEFRQIDWDATFVLSAAAFGLPSTGITTKTLRQLRFRADANHSLTERNEVNNEYVVNLCLYPSTSSCSSACDQ
jgi:hypothetical protein